MILRGPKPAKTISFWRPERTGPPRARTVQLGYLPFRYTITPPIPSATMTNAKVSVLTSMVAPYLVCYGTRTVVVYDCPSVEWRSSLCLRDLMSSQFPYLNGSHANQRLTGRNIRIWF